MTQRLEGELSSTLKNFGVWHIKMQVNQLAHTCMPADFWVNRPDKQILIECKETDVRSNPKNRFTYDRVTQMHDLLAFEYCSSNHSYLLIMFRERFLRKSDIYMIPSEDFKKIFTEYKNKSMTREQFSDQYGDYEVGLDESGDINIKDYIL